MNFVGYVAGQTPQRCHVVTRVAIWPTRPIFTTLNGPRPPGVELKAEEVCRGKLHRQTVRITLLFFAYLCVDVRFVRPAIGWKCIASGPQVMACPCLGPVTPTFSTFG